MANTEEMRDNRRRTYSNSAYDYEYHGNAVRRTFLPDEEPEIIPRRKKVTRKELERRQREAHEKAFGVGSFVLTSLAVLFVCACLVFYLGARGEMHNHTKVVKTMQTTLNEKVVLNDNRETAINASIDLNHIYAYAIARLGLHEPNKNQLLWYVPTESEFISQYEGIPQNN